MLNSDQILKIKGILSAKEGTQVPKFQSPFAPINKPRTPEQLAWLKKKYPDFNSDSPGNYTSMQWATWDKEWEDYQKSKEEAEKEDANKSETNLWGTSQPTQGIPWQEDKTPTEVLGPYKLQTPKEQEKVQKEHQPVDEKTLAAARQSAQKTPTIEDNVKAEGAKMSNPAPKVDPPVQIEPDKSTNSYSNLIEAGLNILRGKEASFTGNKFTINTKPEDIQVNADEGSADSKDLNLLNEKATEAGGDTSVGNKFTDKLKKVVNSKGMQTAGKVSAGVGTVTSIAENLLVDDSKFADDSWNNSSGKQTYDAVANSLMAFSPVGTIAGAAMKVGSLVNSLAGSSTENFSVDKDTLAQVGGSYGGSSATINEAATKAGKKYGLFESGKRSKANNQIREARRQQSVMSDIAKNAQDSQTASTIMSQVNNFNYQYQMNGGFDQRYMRAAKEGTKIQYFKDPFKVVLSDINNFQVELSDVPTMFKAGGTILDKLDTSHSFQIVLSDPVDSLKQGGSIKDREIEVIETDTNQKSVIPEGALHKNKHHLDEVGVDDTELTKKGIPVVDNRGEQQAEIELNEIIFTLEVTKELETRYKEFYEEGTSQSKKDELAIEAGKLLWKEILYNTDDRTGLIDTLKKGGTIQAKSESISKVSDFKWGGSLNQSDIDKMVKQALINILTNG